MLARQIITVSESGEALPLLLISERTDIPIHTLRSRLIELSDRLRRELRPNGEPFMLSDDSIRVNWIAGLIRLTPEVNLEIVPKCFDAANPEWQDDFLLLAAVARLGRLFLRENISAGLLEKHRDVLNLLAATYLDYFERLIRVPIREYIRSSWIEPNLDGELDYSEVWEARPEGFHQGGLSLSANNPYMGLISSVAVRLGQASTDVGIGQRLRRLASSFSDVSNERTPKRVPGRHAHWQELYDLAIAVETGLGMQIRTEGTLRAPSFVVNTVRGWEDLLQLAFGAQGRELHARNQARIVLGTRYPGMNPVHTTPDFVLNPPSLGETVVVDAKYKGTYSEPVRAIDSDDLYEMIAFLTAARSRIGLLLYPGGGSYAPGTVLPFDRVAIGSTWIIGANVITSGIGQSNGLNIFARTLKDCLATIWREL